MKQKHISFADEYARTIAKEFIDHPEYRGEKFTWKSFPEMVRRLAVVSAFTSFPKIKEEEKSHIGEHAKLVCEMVLKEQSLI